MQESLQSIKEKIDLIDMSMIIKKLVMSGWKKPHAEEGVKMYKRLLFLWKKEGTHTKLPPSEEIDEVWHTHILDTEKYHKDCEAIFGRYLHHYPYFGIDGKTTRSDLNKAFEETKRLYREEYGEELCCVKMNFTTILKRLFGK